MTTVPCLDAIALAFVQGERSRAAGQLEAGRLAWEYIAASQEVQPAEDRAVVVGQIRARLETETGRRVDVSVLVATYHAVRILGDGIDHSALPYFTLERFAILAERGRGTEEYTVPDAILADARALFARIAAPGGAMPGKAVEFEVLKLDAQAKAAAAQLARAKANGPDGTPADKAMARKLEERAERAAGKLERRGSKAPEEQSEPAASAPRRTAPAPRNTVDDGTSADELAGMIVECVVEHQSPDDVVESVLTLLRDNLDLSKPTHRAIQAALVVLARDSERRAGQQPAPSTSKPGEAAKAPAVVLAS